HAQTIIRREPQKIGQRPCGEGARKGEPPSYRLEPSDPQETHMTRTSILALAALAAASTAFTSTSASAWGGPMPGSSVHFGGHFVGGYRPTGGWNHVSSYHPVTTWNHFSSYRPAATWNHFGGYRPMIGHWNHFGVGSYVVRRPVWYPHPVFHR